jgi:Rieske Fe-S protein
VADPAEGAWSRGRRRFLRWVSGVSALAAAALAGVPALRAFLSPASRPPREPDWVKLGAASRFELDTPTKVDFAQTVTDAWVENRVPRSVWVYTADGRDFTVYNSRCPHLGCQFDWDRASGEFRCPCHRGVYDVRTGSLLAGPAPRPLDRLVTKIEDGSLYVAYQDFRMGVAEKVAV